MRKIGETDAQKDEAEVQAVVRCLMPLPLLPARDIPQGFEDFADMTTMFSDDCPSKTALKQPIRFTERCIANQWITKSSMGPQKAKSQIPLR